MDIKSKVKLNYDFHLDAYRFFITTPTINYIEKVTPTLRSDEMVVRPVDVKSIGSMQIACLVSSEGIVLEWDVMKQNMVGYVRNALRAQHEKLEDKVVQIILDSVRRVLDSKSAADWIASAENSPHKKHFSPTERLRESLPGLRERVQCPACKNGESILWYVIQHLNDKHKWKREAIADWLDTLDVDLYFPAEDKDDDA